PAAPTSCWPASAAASRPSTPTTTSIWGSPPTTASPRPCISPPASSRPRRGPRPEAPAKGGQSGILYCRWHRRISTGAVEPLAHAHERPRDTAAVVGEAFHRLIAAAPVERLAGERGHELGAGEAFGARGRLAEREDQAADAAAGEGGVRVHGAHARRIPGG